METERIIKRINKIKSWVFKKINMLEKSLKTKKEKYTSLKTKKERYTLIKLEIKGNSTTNTSETHRIIREHFAICIIKLIKHLEKTYAFLDTQDLSKLNQEDIKS